MELSIVAQAFEKGVSQRFLELEYPSYGKSWTGKFQLARFCFRQTTNKWTPILCGPCFRIWIRYGYLGIPTQRFGDVVLWILFCGKVLLISCSIGEACGAAMAKNPTGSLLSPSPQAYLPGKGSLNDDSTTVVLLDYGAFDAALCRQS